MHLRFIDNYSKIKEKKSKLLTTTSKTTRATTKITKATVKTTLLFGWSHAGPSVKPEVRSGCGKRAGSP